MEIKKFKQWLIENQFDEDELFAESIKSYQIDAYRSAYLYSYLGLISCIKEKILNYRGVPTPFKDKKKGCTDEQIKGIWNKRIETLEREDSWEEETLNFINEGAETNIFKLADSVRKEFEQKKIVRNACVHNKKRAVSNATVEDLWDFITYVKPMLEINGSVDMLITKFEKTLQFTDKKDYLQKVDEIYEHYIQLQESGRKSVFEWVMNELETMISWDWESLGCIDMFLERVLKNSGCVEYKWISNIEIALYLRLTLESFIWQYSKVDFQEYAYEKKAEFSYVLTLFGKDEQICEVLSEIYTEKMFKEWWKILLMIVSTFETFQISDNVINIIEGSSEIDSVMEKLENKLYSYNTSWGATQKTDTLDYSRFNTCKSYISIILQARMRGKLFGNKKVDELVARCKKIIKLDYNIEYNKKNYRDMYNFFEKDTAVFEWLKAEK